MTLDQFKQVWARAAVKAATREKDYSALDAAAGGDGDHGEAIVAATKALAAAQGADFKSLLSDMVEHLESDVSGSTSSLYGTLFEGMADAVDAGVTELDAAGVADLFAAGLEELGFATKAKVGDKTFMDALIPAIEALKDHDLVYLHLEAIDECSHLGDLNLKKQAIAEFENRIVAPVMKAFEGKGVTFAVLPDHPVPLHLRKHTRTPVPVAICGDHISPDAVQAYSEADAPKGSLGFMNGEQFMRKVMNLK